MSTIVKGIAASNGIAIGKVYRLVEPDLSFEEVKIENIDAELTRFHEAVKASQVDLETIREHAEAELGSDKAAIFDAHMLVLNDPELITPIESKIKTEKVNAEFALKQTADLFITMFEQMDNEYMKERAADIRDVTKRILSHLLNVKIPNPSMIAEEVIIVGEDLTPSDTAQLNSQFVKGFATDVGGRTSHSAIMARSLEIPAVVGTKTITREVDNGDLIIIDGWNGEVHINPTPEIVKEYKKAQQKAEVHKEELLKLLNEKTVSKDGYQVELAANIGTPNDVDSVIANGAEGIGLYRTEFLYMDKDDFPTEEEQFTAYKTVLERMEGKPVIVRTLDIGGDKQLSYMQLPEEMNPFLGLRAIRLSLKKQEMFRTQLRALLRASSYGQLKVMFPMIATLTELRQAKAIFKEEKEKLLANNITVSDEIDIGIMVEIPATAINADIFAEEVDFFSIGTNDLIQYTMAADRMNERVAYLYQPYNPAILRLIKMVIDAAHKDGKWVGMCGEMAGDELAIPLLLGLGLDELSMSASSVLKARAQISQLRKKDMENLAQKALSLQTTEEVITEVKKVTSM